MSNTRLNVGSSFYASLDILSLPVCFVKGKKTFSNNPKLFLSFFLKVFFTYPFYYQSPAFISVRGIGFVWLVSYPKTFILVPYLAKKKFSLPI